MATTGKRPASRTKYRQPKRIRGKTQPECTEESDVEDPDSEQDGQSSTEGNEVQSFSDAPADATTQLRNLAEQSKEEEKEPEEFQEAVAKQKDGILANLKQRHDEMASMRDEYRQTITKVLESTISSTTPASGSPPKLAAHLLPATLDLNNRFEYALKGSKTLLNAFDSFMQEVHAMDTQSPPTLKRKWEDDDKKGRDILQAACDTADTKVKECLGCVFEKRVKIADEEMDDQVSSLFDFERGGQLGQDSKADELTMGSYVDKMKHYIEKITEMLPEDAD